jgi:hypothetical protein
MAKELLNDAMIAPCGMNCEICIGHIRKRNKCPGCRELDAYKSSYGRECYIRGCQILNSNNWEFCSDKCEKFPCLRLKNLDKRYRTRYGMSMIENLGNIKSLGISNFVESERIRWKCPECGELLCVHKASCLSCGKEKMV